MFMHHVVHAVTLPEAYHRALSILNSVGDIRDCKAYDTREKAIAVTIDIASPLKEPRISKFVICSPESLQQYILEMTEGILDFEARITHNWAYTYHDRMVEQLIEVIRILKKDPNSRRAVVVVRRPEDSELDDPPCLTMIQYMITDGKLDCFVTFRSNDAVKAFFMNAFALIEIQSQIADILGVKVGRYIHTANSFHAYEQDWEKLAAFTLNLGFQKEFTIPYEGEWREMMEESIPDIRRKVEAQKRKYGINHVGYCERPLKDIVKDEFK